MLNTYMEEDAEKFATLIELYTRNKDYLIQVILDNVLIAQIISLKHM